VFVISYPVCESYFATKETTGKFFLQWDRDTGEFMMGVNTPGSGLRAVANPKYQSAKTQKEARKLAEQFYAEAEEEE
jgi:hypothetical protein